MTGWRETRLRNILKRRTRRGFPESELLSVYREYGVVRKQDRADNFNKASDDLNAYFQVRPGDLVLNKMKTWQGSLGVSPYEGIVSPAYFVCEIGPAADGHFLHHLLRSRPLIAEYASRSQGIRPNQWDLPWDQFRDIRVLLPEKREQTRIADFLDRECAHIADLAAALEALVRSARQHADLQRGLALTEHARRWGRAKLGWHTSVLSGYAFPSDGFTTSADGGVRLLRGINVAPGSLRWGDTAYWPRKHGGDLQRFALQKGDLVIGLDRPWITAGLRVARVQEHDLPALLLQRVACLRARDHSLDLDYVRAWLETDLFATEVNTEATGISVPHISPGQVSSFRIAVPPRDEQERFVRSEIHRRTQVEALASEAGALTRALGDYRDALVAELVTGKIDVSADTRQSPASPSLEDRQGSASAL